MVECVGEALLTDDTGTAERLRRPEVPTATDEEEGLSASGAERAPHPRRAEEGEHLRDAESDLRAALEAVPGELTNLGVDCERHAQSPDDGIAPPYPMYSSSPSAMSRAHRIGEVPRGALTVTLFVTFTTAPREGAPHALRIRSVVALL